MASEERLLEGCWAQRLDWVDVKLVQVSRMLFFFKKKKKLKTSKSGEQRM
jgi:hypothetical protein